MFPPDSDTLQNHANVHHRQQLAKKEGYKRETEVTDAKIARFLMDGQDSPVLVNATNKVLDVANGHIMLNAKFWMSSLGPRGGMPRRQRTPIKSMVRGKAAHQDWPSRGEKPPRGNGFTRLKSSMKTSDL